MEMVKEKWKKWVRCQTLGAGSSKKCPNSLRKSKSWHPSIDDESKRKNKCQVAPEGCFSVYVGEEKQRFVVKTEYANHPLFKVLLEDAELEYGYNSEGPILLPCDVDLFCRVLAEMDTSGDHQDIGCTTSFTLCSPSRTRRSNSYSLLTPSRMLKMNQF